MFTIPNEITAGFPRQSGVDQVDIDTLVAGLGGHGLIQGCAVTAQGVPDMTVAVAAGTVQVNGRYVRKVAAGNVAIGAAHATNPRIDLVCVDKAGAKQLRAGTAAPLATLVFPTPTAGDVVLAAVYVPALDAAINANQIIDKRCLLSPLTVASPGCIHVRAEFLAEFTTALANGDRLDSNFFVQFDVAGPGSIVQATGTANEPGRLDVNTGPGTNVFSYVGTFKSAWLAGGGELNGIVELLTEANLSSAAQRYAVRAGFHDITSFVEPVDGIYFRYVDNVNAGKWECVTRQNNTETVADSAVAVVASTRYLLEVDVNAAGTSVDFYINGALVATNVTNIPTAGGRETGFGASITKTVGTTSRKITLDKLEAILLPLTPY